MSTTTKNLGLFKYDIVADENVPFSITNALNNNWDILDEAVKGGGSSRNVGEIVYSSLPLTDAGLHLLDGALIPYGIYKEFIDYIAELYTQDPTANYFTTESAWQSSVTTYGVCGKFVYDATNNTVRLPKYGTQIITKKPTASTVSVSLPVNVNVAVRGNGMTLGVQGSWGYGGLAQLGNDSALTPYQGNYGNPLGQNRSGYHYTSTNSVGLTTDASKSGIVGTGSGTATGSVNLANGLTNYPLDCYYYIVIANSTKTDIQVDIDEIATDLNGKADTDLTNVTNSAKVMMSGMGMPSNRYTDLTLGASGASYTAPADGYFYSRQLYNVGYYDISVGVINLVETTQSNDQLSFLVPCRKGQNLLYNYSNLITGLNYTRFRFIYAVGSESEA